MIHADRFTIYGGMSNWSEKPYLACDLQGCKAPLVTDVTFASLSTLISAAEAHWNKEHAAKEEA